MKYHNLTVNPEEHDIDIGTIQKNNIWIRVIGLSNRGFIEKLCERYSIHRMIVEDILNIDHQPKYEKNEDGYSFFILKTFENSVAFDNDHFCLIVGKDYIITFEEKELSFITTFYDKFNVNNKLSDPNRIAYSIMDCILAHYLKVTNENMDRLDDVQDFIIKETSEESLANLFDFKRQVHLLRRTLRPALDMFESLWQEHVNEHSIYLRDLLDHATRANSIANNIWDGINNTHTEILTQLQYKFSKTMNVMTAVSIIFLPLMVITGIYGMNFHNMPELQYKYGYPIVLLVMTGIVIGLMLLFVRRRLM